MYRFLLPCACSFAMAWMPSVSLAQSGDCADIDNDIARLQCYDGSALRQSESGSMNPQGAFEALANLVNSTVYSDGTSGSHSMTIKQVGHPCVVEISLTTISQDESLASVFISSADFRNVDRIGDWVDAPGQRTWGAASGIRLIYDRGNNGTLTSGWNSSGWLAFPPEEIGLDQMVPNASYSNLQVFSSRDTPIVLSPPELRLDKPSFEEAVSDLLGACQQ